MSTNNGFRYIPVTGYPAYNENMLSSRSFLKQLVQSHITIDFVNDLMDLSVKYQQAIGIETYVAHKIFSSEDLTSDFAKYLTERNILNVEFYKISTTYGLKIATDELYVVFLITHS